MAIGKNIRFHRKVRLGWTLERLETESGVDRGTISALEVRDSSKSDHFQKIAQGLGLTLEQLSISPDDWDLTNINVNNKKNNQDEFTINQYHDVRGAMGNGLVLRGESGQITGWKVTPEWLHKNVPTNTGNKNLAIVTGFGDSMRGMFNSGDPLLVDAGVKNLEYDGVYFFRIGDEGFIKTLQRIPGEGIRVISENKKYETWTITKDMDFEVFGRVLKVWKSEEF
ncbi:LexA family transcriptional regulator [Methylotenera sp.]|uniref:XRE family transcriptional regulator n=1 Tax=Methylotenera sp. TaxID=2051956 RepID=UPI002ED79069